MNHNQSPHKLYTPEIREPLPLRRKPFILPAPPEAGEKPQKINWLATLLPPFIMLIVLSIVATVMQTRGFIVYTMALMGVYPISRVVAYLIQKKIYEKAENERAAKYELALESAQREIVSDIRRQRDLLKAEFLPTANVCKIAEAQGEMRMLWHRTKNAIDFMALRIGVHNGKPSFSIDVPKGDEIDSKDPLLLKAKTIKQKYQSAGDIPFLLPMKEIGSIGILGEEKLRYGLARRLILDVLVHHRPDEVEIFVLSKHPNAVDLWGWLRWAPHCKIFDETKELDHMVLGTQAVKIFLGRLENWISKSDHDVHQFFIIDIDGIQQYDDSFIESLISKAHEWNLSLLFVGGSKMPRSLRGILKFETNNTGVFVDTKIDVKDKEEKEYHTKIELDELPSLTACERITRALSGIKLLSSSGDALLPSSASLFQVLGLGNESKLTYKEVLDNWADNGTKIRLFENKQLLQFPIGLVESNSTLSPYSLNLLETRFGGWDAYHTMLIGTTGSGKSEFIKSLILGAAYKYPPQYLNFFCMDFKGGSTVEQLEKLPHVVGVMTNLDEVLAQRGLIAISHEIDRRQAEFQKAAKYLNKEIKDIWDFNEGRSPEERMPHLVLVLDEFTRGLEMLNTPEFNLQDLLEKRLVPQGRSLGIYLLLANQVVNAKVLKLLPNIGWRIALRVASADQLQFIDSGLKPPRHIGRGYIHPLGEDLIEFQSGYSGDYVKYSDIHIKPKNIQIKELLPDGSIRPLREAATSSENAEKMSPFLEMNQLIDSVVLAAKKISIPDTPKMYLRPLPGSLSLEELEFEKIAYRNFSAMGWEPPYKDRALLQVPIGKIDLVNKRKQYTLVIDFLEKSPNLLIAGSQTDIIAGLRSILFSLLLSHSPDDVQVYMLEFGKGLGTLPPYPHIGSIVAEQESERIARTINYFDTEFSERERLFIAKGNDFIGTLPHLFLIINNIAGLVENINLYRKVFRLVTQESFRYGLHIILTSLPRGTGTRISSSDLKSIKSRIVFPSINHEDYWYYFETTERKLVKLTSNQDNTPYSRVLTRAHWFSISGNSSDEPVELQISLPEYNGQSDENLVGEMNKAAGYCHPEPIRILEKVYKASERELVASTREELALGIQWNNLKNFTVPLRSLPSMWGVSGPKESGKTNFLILLIEQYSFINDAHSIEVFSPYPGPLLDYCKYKKKNIHVGNDSVLKRLKDIESNELQNGLGRKLLVFDDINSFWERDNEPNKEVKRLLEKLSNALYEHKDTMLIASFTYSSAIKGAKARGDALIRELHDSKTALCLGYEGDWMISSTDLLNYKKNVNGVVPIGRGVFVLKGEETELQTFLYEKD